MQIKKSLVTLALAGGLMALPAFAQSSTSSSPSDQSTPNAAQSGSTSDQQAPAAQSGSISDQSSAASQSSTMGADSSSVQSSIQSALQKDDQLSGQSVDTQVSGKKVMLTGTVSSQAQKDHAEQVATQAAGSGYTVKNHIKVSGAAGAAKGATPQQ